MERSLRWPRLQWIECDQRPWGSGGDGGAHVPQEGAGDEVGGGGRQEGGGVAQVIGNFQFPSLFLSLSTSNAGGGLRGKTQEEILTPQSPPLMLKHPRCYDVKLRQFILLPLALFSGSLN